MRNPTPVISSTKTPDSGSYSRPASTLRPFTGRYENRCSSTARLPAGRPPRAKKYVRPSTNATPMLSTPRTCPQRLARRPRTSRTAALTSGIATSSHTLDNTADPSVLQQVRVVDACRAPRPEDGHDDGQPDDDLGRGHHHDEERHDLPVQAAVDAAERDEREVRRVQHQLDAHEQHDRVAPDQHTDRADGEQHTGQDDVVVRVHGHSSVPFRAASAAVSSRTGRIFEMLRSAGAPSGSRAGVATESDVANTPGPGLGAG